jgi:hypothetical protein
MQLGMRRATPWYGTLLVSLLVVLGVGECLAERPQCDFSALVLEARTSGCELLDSFSSSWISQLEYCPNYRGGALMISTKVSPGTYIFQSIPRSVWIAFKEAPSKGTFYSENIRGNPRFLIACNADVEGQ